MKNALTFACSVVFIAAVAFLSSNCNPKCDPVGSISLSSNNNPAEYEILIKATPATSLLGKTISFGDAVVADSAKKFVENVGMVVKIPKNAAGSTKLKIQDLDCSDEVAFDFIVNSKDFYLKNPNFVSPIMPDIIFPTLVNVFPPSIAKAWASPINSDYCFWFGTTLDSILIETGATAALNKYKKFFTLKDKSFEKTTCGFGSDPNKIYALNPIYGYYDTTLVPRKIFFTVDRSSKGAGIEEYIAEFIDMKATNYNKTGLIKVLNCSVEHNATGHMLLVTSKKTGRQTLVFQALSL